MHTVSITPHLRQYLEARGVFLDRFDEMPEPTEVFEPSPEDTAEFVDWRAETEARERDEEEAHRFCEWVEAREAEYRD
jgi:hypothetical protein